MVKRKTMMRLSSVLKTIATMNGVFALVNGRPPYTAPPSRQHSRRGERRPMAV
jgi:hypothetical protein